MKYQDDAVALQAALIRWFASQEADYEAATYVCARLAGQLAAVIATGNRKRTEDGVEILVEVMRTAAEVVCTRIAEEEAQ